MLGKHKNKLLSIFIAFVLTFTMLIVVGKVYAGDLELSSEIDKNSWIKILKDYGLYEYIMEDEAGQANVALRECVGPIFKEAVKTGEPEYNKERGETYQLYTVDIDVDPQDTEIYQGMPNGSINKLAIHKDNDNRLNIWFRLSSEENPQQEGLHIFLIRKADVWYITVINYKESEEPATNPQLQDVVVNGVVYTPEMYANIYITEGELNVIEEFTVRATEKAADIDVTVTTTLANGTVVHEILAKEQNVKEVNLDLAGMKKKHGRLPAGVYYFKIKLTNNKGKVTEIEIPLNATKPEEPKDVATIEAEVDYHAVWNAERGTWYLKVTVPGEKLDVESINSIKAIKRAGKVLDIPNELQPDSDKVLWFSVAKADGKTDLKGDGEYAYEVIRQDDSKYIFRFTYVAENVQGVEKVLSSYVAELTMPNILIIGDYAFDLNDPDNNNYNLNNFLRATQSAYFVIESEIKRYEIYYSVGHDADGVIWYDLVKTDQLGSLGEEAKVAANDVNGNGLFKYMNMKDLTNFSFVKPQ